MTEQGIIVLERKRQLFLNTRPTKVYWNNQNIHSLRGGENDSFFVEAGKGHLTVKAGLFGTATLKLEVSASKRQHLRIYFNISTVEMWLRLLVTIGAFGLAAFSLISNRIDTSTAGFILLAVLIGNVFLSFNRLRVQNAAKATSKQVKEVA